MRDAGQRSFARLARRLGAKVPGEPPAGAPAPAPPEPPPAPRPPAEEVAHCWDLGHYYSPVPDTRELAREPARSRVWPTRPRAMPGVDWREEEQVALVRDIVGSQEPIRFPDGPTGDQTEYHTANELFSRVDAWALQAMLRHVPPRRVIEVGSGWSSLVTARVNREYLEGQADVTCIEPYPSDFLMGGVAGMSRLIASPVQEVPVKQFQALGSGDVLFIDTAHVIKTGGDVKYLYHEVLPRLAPGVAVHIHDIFLPWDYPEDWVLVGRGWNEQYLVQSFLAFNDTYEVMLAMAWLCRTHPELLATQVPRFDPAVDGAGSLWIRRAR